MRLRYLFGMGVILLLLTSGLIAGEENNEDSENPPITAIIAQGEYIKSSEYYLDEGDVIKIDVEVTQGGPVDVYLMTNNQYEAAYGDENGSIKAISYLKGEENVTTASFKFAAPTIEDDEDIYFEYYNYFDTLYVVVDNRNCTLTPNDANSIGPVKVTIEIKVDPKEFTTIFDPFILGCVIIGIILLVIIIIIIIFFVREGKRKSSELKQLYQQQPQQPQQHYYPYPPWPPQAPPQTPSHELKKRKTTHGKRRSNK